MSYTNVLQMGNKHQEMIKLADFYDKEIDFMKGLLKEVVSKNTAKEMTTEAEHFQNQFLIQQRNIEESKKRVESNQHLAYIDAKEHAGKIDTALLTDEADISTELNGIEKIILELRHNFKLFLVKWM